MSNRGDLFEYGGADYIDSEDRVVVEVPAGISAVDMLLHVLARSLQLPPYFGFNWNALSDCLRDFHWMREREIVLVHRDLPDLPIPELTAYLGVLAEACESWQSDEDHALRVVFPQSARPGISRHLAAPP